MTHTNYIVPFNFGMVVPEFVRQFIGSLPYYLDAVNKCVAM